MPPFPKRVAPRVADIGPIAGIVALGTGAVSDQNRLVGVVTRDCVVTGVTVKQSADITGTGLTLNLFARTAAGAAGSSILASTVSLDAASAAAALAGQTASLSATASALKLTKGMLIEAVLDATSVTAGPGDVAITIEVAPVA